MKAPTLAPLTSFILKLVGIVLILDYLIDLVVYLLAANFQNNQWVVTLTTQLVDRGVIPLIGLGALFTGFWVEGTSNSTEGSSRGLKLAALWLSSVLGLAFLLIVPLHVNATRLAAEDQIKQVDQQVSQLESQVNTQLNAQLQQARGQLDAQLSKLDQAIKSGQLQGNELAQAKQQQEQYEKLKTDPKALEAQVAPSRDKALKQIRDRKQELVDQTNRGAMQTGMRIGLNSLLLAIAYAIVGWIGLRQMLNPQEPRS